MKKIITLIALILVPISITTAIFAQQERKRSKAVDTPPTANGNLANESNPSTENATEDPRPQFANSALAGNDNVNSIPQDRPNQLPIPQGFANSRFHNQDRKRQDPGPSESFNRGSDNRFTPNTRPFVNFNHRSPEQIELDKLRIRYANLATRVSKAFDKEELEAKIEALEKRLAEENAQLGLQSVKENLQALVKKYPDTKAAKQASSMLESIKESQSESVSVE